MASLLTFTALSECNNFIGEIEGYWVYMLYIL